MSRTQTRLRGAASGLVLLLAGCIPGAGSDAGARGNPEQTPVEAGTGAPAALSCQAFDAEGLLGCIYSGLTQRERRVLTTPGELADVWARAHSRGSPQPPLPAVDFSREHVVLAAMGEQRSGGYGITVQAPVQAGEAREVTVLEWSPGEGCIVTDALTQPFALRRIPSTGGPVRFVERTQVIDCG